MNSTQIYRSESEAGSHVRASRTADPRLRSLLQRDYVGVSQAGAEPSSWVQPPIAAVSLVVTLEGPVSASGRPLPDAWLGGLGGECQTVYRCAMTDPQPPIIPVLVCDDIAAEHDFLVGAFGFEPGGVSLGPDGAAVHGEVRTGAAVIWLHRASPEHDLAAPTAPPGQSGGLAVNVADVDAHHAHACRAGAQIDAPPTDQPYGRREYGARDPEGHRWWFGTPTPLE